MNKHNEVIITLGSNTTHRVKSVEDAYIWLCKMIDVAVWSGPYETKPEGEGTGCAPYCNAVLKALTYLSASQLVSLCKEYELNHGRKPHNTGGEVTIDIDVVFFNNDVLSSTNAASNYFRTGINLLDCQNDT